MRDCFDLRFYIACCMVMGPGTHYVAVRTQTYKYIWFMARPEEPELYDLTADPGERQNVVDRHPDLARRFQSVVEYHLERVQATHADSEEEKPTEVPEEVLERLRGLGYLG